MYIPVLQVAPFFVCGTIISTFEKKCATAPAQKCAEQNVQANIHHSTFLCCTKIYSKKSSMLKKQHLYLHKNVILLAFLSKKCKKPYLFHYLKHNFCDTNDPH